MNVLDRDYRSLMRPLEYYQTLPVGFMWLARGVTEWFGVSERPLRLIAYLAGMGSLIVFWRITEIIRRSLPQVPPWSSLFALGIFAVSYTTLSVTGMRSSRTRLICSWRHSCSGWLWAGSLSRPVSVPPRQR